ncbi:sensor histidine kinase [Streptomyces sp. NPDC090025]|uniref:sensor histidine kinase n=1 Tax=Streptomyces sp. NPDC090025 TaxID=3365922 RepID=UPI0038334538
MDEDVVPRPRGWRQSRQRSWRLVAAAALGIPFWLATGAALPPGCATGSCAWFVTGDPLVALGALTALLWRRRFPLAVAVAVAVASSASALATGAALLALCSVSARRRPAWTAVAALALVAASPFTFLIYPVTGPPGSMWRTLALTALSAGTAVAVGVAMGAVVGARRVEVRSLRERAESAERERAAHAARVRALERNRIARDMHDVLAHRISLVALQAGALDHRGDLTPAENRTLIRGIADGSRQALEELRDVLGVLRAEPGDPGDPGESGDPGGLRDPDPDSDSDPGRGQPEAIQPLFDRVPDLVADARASGLDVTFTTMVAGRPPDLVGGTCYRVVQEGLTNAVKHAPGAPVRVIVEGTTGCGLRVRVDTSPASTATASTATASAARPPASGFGLLGLTERVTLVGGELRHHPTPEGGYVLTARLPWPNVIASEES